MQGEVEDESENDEQRSNSLLLPIDEWEEDEESQQAEQEGPEQAEVARRKKRLDEQQRQLEEARAQQEKERKRQEKERFIEFGKSDISFLPFADRDARKEDQLFVAPRDYQWFVDEITEDTSKHILLVAGKESSGKLMTAFYLARHAWENNELECYRYYAQGKRFFLDIMADEKLPDNAVIVFDEVFNKGQIDPDVLTSPYLHLNEWLVNKTNVWFIFTVLEGPILEKLRATGYFPILSTAQVDRRQVLEKLIDYHFPVDFFEEERARLLSAAGELPSPARLSQLFETERNPEAVLQGFSQKEDQPPETPYTWFSQLTPMNYQLYALLVVLLDKLERRTLEEIYAEAVNGLRRQGMDGPDEFIDPRRIGTNLVHARLGIQERYTALEFRNRLYRQYVEAQVENFHRLLWSLIDPDDPSTFEGLVGMIQRLSEIDAQLTSPEEKNGQAAASHDQPRQLRSAIAVMIARVGVYHQTKLDVLLEKLVRDESAVVSLTAAEVLAEIARRGNHFDSIERVLRAWIQGGRFKQMWAAATGIVYIYNAIAGTRTEEDKQDEEREEEHDDATAWDQKQDWKGYLARVRDMLTELVKMHDRFSEEAIQEARRAKYAAYRERLRQQFEAASKPVMGNARLFRDLGEREQEQYLNLAFLDNKGTIDEAVEHDINVLTKSWKNQMRAVLMQSLEHIAQMRPRDIERLIRAWLDHKDTESLLWQIGHMVLVNGESLDFLENLAHANQKVQAEIALAVHTEQDHAAQLNIGSQIQNTKAVKIFYCYARKDKVLRDELEKHLAALERSGQIITWHDRKILPGTEWKHEISNQLDTSDIILLLVSPNFIHSDYCYSIEMQRALERHRAGAVHVIPIILRPCDWKAMPIHALQALPENGRPISHWRNRDDAFQIVVKGIRQVIDTFYSTLSRREESDREAEYKEMILCPYCLVMQELQQGNQCNNLQCRRKVPPKYVESARHGNLTCLGTFGLPRQGKTAFLASLVESVQGVVKIVPGSFVSPINDETMDVLNEWRARFSSGTVNMPSMAPSERPNPLLLMNHKFCTKNKSILVAYDLAGEALVRAGSQPEYMRALSKVNTLWNVVSLYDLINKNEEGHDLAGLFNTYLEAMTSLQIPILGKNILVVYTKADVLLGINEGLEPLPSEIINYLGIDPYSQIRTKRSAELPPFDEDAYFARMCEISDILQEYTIDYVPSGGAFIAMAREEGANVYFTINSAFGGDPDGGVTRIGFPVRGYRVLDALIWALKLNSQPLSKQ